MSSRRSASFPARWRCCSSSCGSSIRCDGGWRPIIAVAATFGVWAALTKWLKIQLPAGILAGILASGAGPWTSSRVSPRGSPSRCSPINLLYCFIGVFIGTLVGVLPGIGPVSAMSLLLPVTLSGTPEAGIIMMAGIYYGSMYGGSTTSILVNIPGEAASVVTCLDGHEMAKQGRAGPALGMAALASFAAGTFAIIALMLVAPTLARVAVAFGPPEYFSLMVLGLTILSFLSQGSMAKALLMAAFGILLGPHRHGPDHGAGAADLRPARAARRHRPGARS